MDEAELLVFAFSVYLTYRFIKNWYVPLVSIWPPVKRKAVRNTFGWLPTVSLGIILYTLTALASFDVVDSFGYILFYIIIGYAWLYLGLNFMAFFFNLSWIDDALNLNNKAALISITGGFLGLTILYAGANIGDGPGWWCVIFAGGLGLCLWILLALLVNLFTQVFERITVERDISCGIRMGSYLLGSGIILGRASAGDWTSFSMTIVEFMAGWPVLLLTALTIVVESCYHHIHKLNMQDNQKSNKLASSIFWAIVYLIIAVTSVMLLPLNDNPLYSSVPAGFIQ